MIQSTPPTDWQGSVVGPGGVTPHVSSTVEGVDWIIDDAEAPHYRITTFGRTPAVEIYLDNDIVPSADVLDRLSRIVSLLPADGATCTDRVDPSS